MKKYLFFGATIWFIFASSFAHAEINQSYQNCLCRCGCSAVGWDCTAVSCTFNTTDYDGTPSCEDPGNGPCRCEGFGCNRAPIVTNGECYDACLPYLTSEACEQHKNEYETTRTNYLENINAHQDLINFEYKLVATIRASTLILGTQFVAQHLSDAATSFTKLVADIVNDKILKYLNV